MCLTVLINLLGCFEHLEYALLCQCRGEDNGEVDKRSHAVAYGILECLDDSLVLVFYKVPLVHHNDKRLVVALNELEYVHILRLYTASSVKHEYAHVRILNGAYRAHHRIELQVFRHLVLTAYTGGVYEIEIESELIEASVNRVACSACYLSHDVAILADESVDNRALACVRTTYNCETWDAVFHLFPGVGLKLREYEVEQIARTTARC